MRKNGLASLIPLYFIVLIDNLSVSLIIPVLIPITYDADIGIMSSGASSTRDVFYGVAIGSYSLAMFLGAPLLGLPHDLHTGAPAAGQTGEGADAVRLDQRHGVVDKDRNCRRLRCRQDNVRRRGVGDRAAAHRGPRHERLGRPR